MLVMQIMAVSGFALYFVLNIVFALIMFTGGTLTAYYFFIFRFWRNEPPDDEPTKQKETIGAGKLPALVFCVFVPVKSESVNCLTLDVKQFGLE